MTRIDAMYQERADLINKATVLFDRAKANGDQWTGEDEAEFNRLHDAADAKKTEIEAAKTAAAREQRHTVAVGSLTESRGRRVPASDPGVGSADRNAGPTFRGQPMRLPNGSPVARRAGVEYAAAFGAYLADGVPQAALQTDIDNQGGYLAPPQYVAELVAEMDSTFWMRRLARVLPPTTSPKVTMPRRTARMSAFVWGSELQEVTPNTGYRLGTYDLTPHYMSGEIEVSNDLMAAASISPESIVRGEMIHHAGELEEQAFLYGTGDREPLGVFAVDSQGIPASRDVTGVITTVDVFYDAKFSLREPYLRSNSLRWLFHRYAVRNLAKFKNSQNDPLWVTSAREGEPDRFCGVPVAMSEYAPSGVASDGVFTSGDYFGAIGDFGYYDILDGLDMGITRHTDSHYNRRNMVGFIVRRKVDGCPRHAEAFARVKKS